MVNSSGRSRVNRSACSSVAVTVPAPPAGQLSARLPPLSQKYEPGLRASRRRPLTVPLQTASLIAAAARPPM